MKPDKLRQRIEQYGVPELSEASGVPTTTLYSFLDKKSRNMRSDTLAKVMAALDGPVSDGLIVAGEAYHPIPVYDIRAAAGAGALVEDGQPTSYQVFREQFLSRIARQIGDLSVIQVSGDSMWDTLHDGDMVLVDRSVRRIVKDGIYVLLYDDELLVKRCQRDLSDDGVDIMSDNPRYKSYHITGDERLRVIGRVIWIGRVLG